VAGSIQILGDISMMAEEVEDMQSEIAAEIYQTCIEVRKSMAKTVAAKSNLGYDVIQILPYLSSIDLID